MSKPMTRREARELVLHMIFQQDFGGQEADALLGDYLTGESFAALREEYALYGRLPDEKQEPYVRDAITGAVERQEELDGYITTYSVGWNLSRISRVSKCLLRLSMLEIKYLDIPMKASVNEAVELCKRYDSEEASQFVNGILASFIKAEVPPAE